MHTFGRLFPVIFAVTLPMAVGACSSVDDLESRVTQMDRTVSEASNKAILLNVVRASLSEPLNNTSLSGFDGHQGFQATLGIPNITVGGVRANSTQYVTTGSSGYVSASDDFHVSSNDDSATYTALNTPLNPAVIAYFIAQEYPRELILFLATSRIRAVDARSGRLLFDYANRGVTRAEVERSPGRTEFEGFATQLQDLIDGGLTAQVSASEVLSPSNSPASKFCFDPLLPRPYDVGLHPEIKPISLSPSCGKAKFVKLGSKEMAPAASYDFVAGPVRYELFLRSAFGIYNYIGLLVNEHARVAILKDEVDQADPYLVTVVHEEPPEGCFVSEEYRGVFYCVPNGATTTKKIFSIVHSIIKINTTSQPQPTTPTARIIGG